MKIQIIGFVLKTEQWENDETRKDVFIQEYTSKDEIILMCPEYKYSLLKKCQRNKKLMFFVDLKVLEFGSYKRNYLILENVINTK